ncbi:SLAF5 protein, partial [Podargus strigoides]|nr:SLAF5 protein [Podargus strigoides]
SSACAHDGEEVTGAVGKSVTFCLQSMDGQSALWSFHAEAIAVVKFSDPPETTFFDENFKPRLAFSEGGSALTISQLRMEDAGTYTAKITGVKTTFTFTLHVYRELAAPTVTCAARNCSADGCRYALRCAAAGSGNVTYGWNVGDRLWRAGPVLLVEESPSDELQLTCTAQNPVSSRNVTVVSLGALCAGKGCGRIHG